MRALSLKTLLARLMFSGAMLCAGVVANAQMSSPPEFFEKHFQFEATDARDGPKLRTQFDYAAYDTLITRSSVKFNNNGFEQHASVGTVQNLGASRAGVTYNLHRFNYTSWERQADDVTFDFHYRSLRAQHRLEDNAQVSSVGLPMDIKQLHLDLSFTQTARVNVADTIDVYKLVSRLGRMKVSATFNDAPVNSATSYDAEYRPSGRWLLKYAYADKGYALQRKFRSEYARRGYRLAGEYRSQTYTGDQTHVAGTLGFEKNTKLAALKLQFEYNDYFDSPSVSMKLESRALF